LKYNVPATSSTIGQARTSRPGGAGTLNAVRRFGTSLRGRAPARAASTSAHAPAALTMMGAENAPVAVSTCHRPSRWVIASTSAETRIDAPRDLAARRYP